MRKIVIASLLFAAAAFAADTPADFAGRWTLDKTQSRTLPPYYENITEHLLDVRQDANELVVDVTIKAADREPDQFDFRYRLDGTPTQMQTRMRTQNGPTTVPTTLIAKPGPNGTLAITIEREIPMRGETFKGTTVETWHRDGDMLVIDRADDTPRGRMETTMVFRRVKT